MKTLGALGLLALAAPPSSVVDGFNILPQGRLFQHVRLGPLHVASPDVNTEGVDTASLTVPELKNLCREKGLKVGGKKADLIARLQEAPKIDDFTPSTDEGPGNNAIAISITKASSAAPTTVTPTPVLTDEDLLPENSKGPLPQYVDPTRRPRAEREERGSEKGYRGASTDRNFGPRASTDRNFGPKGHDYTRAPDDAKNGRDLTADEIAAIDELLAKRLQAKLQRDFRIADDLQMRLRRMSVEVHDGFKFWRADGGSDFSQRSDQPARGGRSLATYERTAPPDADLDEATIIALIEERAAAKVEGDYAKADQIRSKILETFHVELNDKSRKWAWINPATGHPFMPLDGHLTAQLLSDEVAQAEVNDLLKMRFNAKRTRDFRSADEAQNALRSRGVEVDDLNYRWRYKPEENV